MPQIVIGDNQNRVKDSYASASIIDLTLRANGEEAVMVMDSLGQFTPAGFTPPSVAPATAIGVGSGFTPLLYVAYRYVYAATERYPYVQNAVSAGGNISPRSNPSPSTSYQIDATGKGCFVTVTNSLRVDISRIWIYRTAYYASAAEAITAADAGLCNYVGQVLNNAVPGTITFSDIIPIVSGNELLETDNFPAPEFALALYNPPYFYGYGNQEFVAPISVDANGLVTLTTSTDKWFNGRNSQIVTMDQITSGGFDGYGGYYFKWLTSTTAQLCLDIALTQNGPVNAAGTTLIHIKGESTTLYRSKPNNPFSWGETIAISDINVPQLYAQKVGGGQGTAIAVVPILNLLKLDTEGPNKTFVFNLNGQGTPTFEASKREISNDFSTSNHWSQFTAKGADGNSYLRFFDYKYKAICQADGAVNTSVSSNIFETLRDLSTNESDRKFAHGIYDPGLELSVVWLTTSGSTVRNNLAVLYHHPTDQWSMVDQRDVLCSISFLDRLSNEQITLIGTETGRIGQAFAKNYYWDWLKPATVSAGVIPVAAVNPTGLTNLTVIDYTNGLETASQVGVWCYIYINDGFDGPIDQRYRIIGSARISQYEYPDPINGPPFASIFFDKFLDPDGNPVLNLQALVLPPRSYFTSNLELLPGMILCNGCKFFNSPNPSQAVTMTRVYAVADNSPNVITTGGVDVVSPFRLLIQPEYEVGISEQTLSFFGQDTRGKNAVNGASEYILTVPANVWVSNHPFKVDKWRGFRVTLQQVGYQKFTLYSYQIAYDA